MNGLDFLGLILLVIVVHGRIVDIHKEVSNIVRYHNHERREKYLMASNMLEMRWDHELARQAEKYSERCRYIYPSPQEFDVGSNLYAERDFVHGARTVERLINTSLEAWTLAKKFYLYGSQCGLACSYVQMITAQADRIGCALSICNKLNNGIRIESSVSLFVCFYSPRTNLMASVPYRRDFPCSHCPAGSSCHRGLCSQKDMLTPSEIQQLTSAHNRIRSANTRDLLTWDSYLERWAQWIVRCDSDYPGPAHSYTNFERLEMGDDLYQRICGWQSEGPVANIQLIHACRTPYDRDRCNHFTNVLQPMLTSMACAAKVCTDDTRQLVCIYDNKVNRALRLRRTFE